MQRCANESIALMLTTVPDIKSGPEQKHAPIVARPVSLSNTGSAGSGVPWKGSPVKKYTSSTAVKGICSPRTRKQCSSGLHIWSRNCSKYSCVRINGHSKNFSNPQVAKVARTSGPALATASRNCDQSRSRHRTAIVTAGHLHTTQSPISAYATIKCITKTQFSPFKTCLKGAIFSPTGAHTCAPVHYTGVHMCVPVHYTGTLLSAPVYHTGAHMCTPVQPTGAHLCAPVQLTGAPIGRALNYSTRAPMHSYSVNRRTRMRAFH
jgi:hypothetical protein